MAPAERRRLDDGGCRPAAAAVLDFWFAERCRALWFARDEGFDAEIATLFAALTDIAAQERLADWEGTAPEALALVILLDQFPRNLFRGSSRAFAADPLARAVAGRAIGRGLDLATPWDRRAFFYLPFEHSEDAGDQDRSVALFEAWVWASPPERRADAEEQHEYVLRHHEIIRRFGRFPHRNEMLGRATTAEEAAFLQEPRSSF
jgi:uncharacterized protein (DUF924 family)